MTAMSTSRQISMFLHGKKRILFLCLSLLGLFPLYEGQCVFSEDTPHPLQDLIDSFVKQSSGYPQRSKLLLDLAQAYAKGHSYEDALQLLQARIDIGGGDQEEIWAAMYLMGMFNEDRGDWNKALRWYEKAYQDFPDRAEPLYKIAQHYRKAGQHDTAYLYARQGAKIPKPHESKRFFEPSLYDYQFDEELSLSAYYTPHREEGRNITNRLMLKKGLPKAAQILAYKNMVFYAPFIKIAHSREIKFKLPQVREGMRETYSPLNPSIRKTAEGYRVLCRTVNYIRFGKAGLKVKDPIDKTMSTRNFLIDYDTHFNVISQREIVEDFPRAWTFPAKGLEDCRLFSYHNQDWFTCASIGTHPRKIGQSLCKLAEDAPGSSIKVERLIPLKGPNDDRVEKNWLPFVIENELFVIYSYDPLIIYKIDPDTGATEPVVADNPPLNLTCFRGSAAPIQWEEGYLAVVHEVVFNDTGPKYMHRFMQFDKDFQIKALSKPFFFYHKGVEYCAGMTLDHSGNNLILTIGVEDREAHLVTLSVEDVKPLLEKFPPDEMGSEKRSSLIQ